MEKTVVTLQNDKPVVVERIDKGLVIGRHEMVPSAFIKSLARELPFEILFSMVVDAVNNHNAFEEYFEIIDTYTYQQDSQGNKVNLAFQQFLGHLLDNSPREWLIEPKLYDFIIKVLSSINIVGEGEEVIIDMFKAINRSIKIQEHDIFGELALNIFKKLMDVSQSKKILKEFLSVIYGNLTEKNKAELEKWFIQNIDLLPSNSKVEIIAKILKDKDFLNEIYYNLQSDQIVFDQWLNNMVDKMPIEWRIEGFRRAIRPEDVLLKSISIPKNCTNIEMSISKVIYSIEIPKQRMRVKFGSAVYDDIGHPRLLAKIEVKDDNLFQSMSLYALKEGSDVLYKYPYSNVYASGKVCWNAYVENTPISMKEIEMLPMLFLSTPNNSHLNKMTLDLFKKNEGVDFNDDDLIPFD